MTIYAYGFDNNYICNAYSIHRIIMRWCYNRLFLACFRVPSEFSDPFVKLKQRTNPRHHLVSKKVSVTVITMSDRVALTRDYNC